MSENELAKFCPNCGGQTNGMFCSSCGQKLVAVPFTISSVFRSALEIIDFNRGFFFTLFMILAKPGKMINDYLSGKTQNYNNPLRLLISVVALGALVETFRTGLEEIKVFYAVPVILVLVILNVATNRIISKKKLFFVEHLIVSTYTVTAVVFLAGITTSFFLYLESYQILSYSDVTVSSITGGFVLLYLFVSYKSVFGSSTLLSVCQTIIFLLSMPALAFFISICIKLFEAAFS